MRPWSNSPWPRAPATAGGPAINEPRRGKTARSWERATQVMALAMRTCERSHQLTLESQRLRLEAWALRTLGPRMPGANPLTVTLTWEILRVRGLLTPREQGLPAGA